MHELHTEHQHTRTCPERRDTYTHFMVTYIYIIVDTLCIDCRLCLRYLQGNDRGPDRERDEIFVIS